MTKVKLSGVISEISGNINGSYFSKGANGSVVLSKSPTHEKGYTFWRNRYTALHARIINKWRTLTDLQRKSWSHETVNNLTGYELFSSCNYFRLQAGLTFLNTPEPYPVFANVNITSFFFTDIVTRFDFTPTPLPTGFNIFFYASGNLSKGIKNPNKYIQYLANYNQGVPSPQRPSGQWAAKNGLHIVGYNCWADFYLMHRASGYVKFLRRRSNFL